MYLGRPVEYGSGKAIFDHPRHPYTRALLSATPIADPTHHKERIRLQGETPSPINPPSGCAFHPRCPLAFDRCRSERPELGDQGRRSGSPVLPRVTPSVEPSESVVALNPVA